MTIRMWLSSAAQTCALAISFLISSYAVRYASGQTFSGGGSDSNWSTAANWGGGVVPTSNTSTNISIVNGQATSTQDLASPFEFQRISLDGTDDHLITGNAIRGGNISASSTGNLTIDSDLSSPFGISFLPSNGVTITVNGDIASGGQIFASGGVGSTLILNGNNNFDDSVSCCSFVAGVDLAIGSDNALNGVTQLQFFSGSIRADGAPRTISSRLLPWGGVSSVVNVFSVVTFGGSNDLQFTDTTPIQTGQQGNPHFGTLRSTNTGTTTIDAAINGRAGSMVYAAGGNFVVGNPNSFTGFTTQGSIQVDPGATLTMRSAAFVELPSTPLTGGTLAAPNGVSLGSGKSVFGSGNINAKIAAQAGSVISATTGDFVIGDANSLAGFFSDGELFINDNTVTINDSNEVVLGSLTQLGDGTNGGSLVAGAAVVADTFDHFFLEEGKNVFGRGSITGNFKNNGHVIGDGNASLSERITFESGWTVSGFGTFENVLFNGTFAPGQSPGITEGSNQAFAGTVEIELGGLLPGNAAENHDQIRDGGAVELLSGASLNIVPFNDFMPDVDDEFVILTWQDGMEGTFESIAVDPWYTRQGLGFELDIENSAGTGQMSLRAISVPEPAAVHIAAILFVIVCTLRRKPL